MSAPRPEDADLARRIRTTLERLINTALLSELTVEEAALGFTPEDVAAFQRAEVERCRARYGHQ